MTCSGITLTNNEIKDIITVIKSLESRGMLLNGTTRKITSQEGGRLSFIRPLMTGALPLMKSVTPSAGMSAIQQKIYGSGRTALIISNEETEGIIKIVKSLEESGLLIKGISETTKNEAKERKGGFVIRNINC